MGRPGVVPVGESCVDGRHCSVVAICSHPGVTLAMSPATWRARLWASQRAASTEAFDTPSQHAAWKTIPRGTSSAAVTGSSRPNRRWQWPSGRTRESRCSGAVASHADLASRRGEQGHRGSDRLDSLNRIASDRIGDGDLHVRVTGDLCRRVARLRPPAVLRCPPCWASAPRLPPPSRRD